MTSLMDELTSGASRPDPRFRRAPENWTFETAVETACREGLEFGDDHWEMVRALHEYYARHAEIAINPRELRDALDEKFHHRGGIKYLYALFPGGPVAQGCRLAGLKMPAGAIDQGLGSVA